MSFCIKRKNTSSSPVLVTEADILADKIQEKISSIQKTENGRFLYYPHNQISITPTITLVADKDTNPLFTNPVLNDQEFTYNSDQKKWLLSTNSKNNKKNK